MWSYAGYRNKDGSITFGPKGEATAKQDNGMHASAAQEAGNSMQHAGVPLPRPPHPGVTPQGDPFPRWDGASPHGALPTQLSGEPGSRMLTPSECQAFGVPHGTCWKEKNSEAATRTEYASPSPVMYGGYMPGRGAVGSTPPISSSMEREQNTTWQA